MIENNNTTPDTITVDRQTYLEMKKQADEINEWIASYGAGDETPMEILTSSKKIMSDLVETTMKLTKTNLKACGVLSGIRKALADREPYESYVEAIEGMKSELQEGETRQNLLLFMIDVLKGEVAGDRNVADALEKTRKALTGEEFTRLIKHIVKED